MGGRTASKKASVETGFGHAGRKREETVISQQRDLGGG